MNGRRLSRDLSIYVKKLNRGKDIADAKNYLSKLKTAPRRLLLQVGTNTLARSDVTNTKLEMQDLLSFARTKFPDSKLYVSSVLPRLYEASFNNDARILNAAVKQIAAGVTGCEMFANDELHNPHRRQTLYHRDGIHLTSRGTAALAVSIKAALGLGSGTNNQPYHRMLYRRSQVSTAESTDPPQTRHVNTKTTVRTELGNPAQYSATNPQSLANSKIATRKRHDTYAATVSQGASALRCIGTFQRGSHPEPTSTPPTASCDLNHTVPPSTDSTQNSQEGPYTNPTPANASCRQQAFLDAMVKLARDFIL